MAVHTGDEAGRNGVLLLNMGGPWTLDDVKPFLRAVFGDRRVIRFPGGPALQGIWARSIAAVRASKVRARYEMIGGGSPLLDWTRRQAAGLAELLGGWPVEVAMRYSEPRVTGAIDRLADAGCRRIVLLPLYPQECGATTGSSLADARRAVDGRADDIEVVEVRSYHDWPPYVRAVAARIREGLTLFTQAVRERIVVLFSAHGVPMRLERSGDPYVSQVRRTVDLVLQELGSEVGEHRLSFQSRAGPVRWVGPSTIEAVQQLGSEGVAGLLVSPISFVSDHIETLHEVDIELRELALGAGIAEFHRAPSLNDSSLFIEALRGVVEESVKRPGGADA
jgi:ferrochelatase